MHERMHLLGGQQGTPLLLLLLLLLSATGAKEVCRLLERSSAIPSPLGLLCAASSPLLMYITRAGWRRELPSPQALPSTTIDDAAPLSFNKAVASLSHLQDTGMSLLCHSIEYSLPGDTTAILSTQQRLHRGSRCTWPCGGASCLSSSRCSHRQSNGRVHPIRHQIGRWRAPQASARCTRPHCCPMLRRS